MPLAFLYQLVHIPARKPRRAYNPYVKSEKKRIHQYTAFFDANEHGGYTVTVPSLPGLVTEGEDLDHARSMAKDAIQCYIEGLKKASESLPVDQETAQLKISVTA